MTSHAYRSIEAGRPATPSRILSVSTATFWRLINRAYRSAAIDRHALIGRSGCINGYKIRNADLTVSRWRDIGLDRSFNGIIMMLCFLVNNNGIMMMLCQAIARHNAIVMMLWFMLNNNAIVMMLWFTVNNNGIMMALCPKVETIENDSHYQERMILIPRKNDSHSRPRYDPSLSLDTDPACP